MRACSRNASKRTGWRCNNTSLKISIRASPLLALVRLQMGQSRVTHQKLRAVGVRHAIETGFPGGPQLTGPPDRVCEEPRAAILKERWSGSDCANPIHGCYLSLSSRQKGCACYLERGHIWDCHDTFNLAREASDFLSHHDGFTFEIVQGWCYRCRYRCRLPPSSR